MEESLQKLPIHRSLTRPLLILGGEREVTLMLLLFVGVMFVTYDRYAIIIGVLTWFIGTWGARAAAKADPQMLRVWLRYMKYSNNYIGTAPTDINYNPVNPEFAELLPYGSLIDEHVILNKDGSLSCAFYYTGKDVDSSSPSERNVIALHIKNAFNQLGTGWMLQADLIRVPADKYPDPEQSHFEDKISLLIEAERRALFEAEGAHYQTINALIITYKPPKQNESNFLNIFIVDDSNKNVSLAERHLEYFKATVNTLVSRLSTHLKIDRMGAIKEIDEDGNIRVNNAFIQYLNFIITGKPNKIEMPQAPTYVDSLISYQDFSTGLSPKLNDDFIGVVTIDGFPMESAPNVLRALDVLPMKYRVNTRYIFLDSYAAKKITKKYQEKWEQKVRGFVDQLTGNFTGRKNKDAKNMSEDAENASTELESGLVSYGFYSATIIIREKTLADVEFYTGKIEKALQAANFEAKIETVNAVDAFLGTLPSESLKNVRRPLINTFNLSHFIPLASIWAGRETNPCPYYPKDSPPLMYTSTNGCTPFRLNTHVGDVGHFLMFGGTGGGKSTAVSMLSAQFRRYKNNKIFIFDKGGSAKPITLAMGGRHYDIGDEKSTLDFYPLGNIDGDPKDFVFAVELIETLVLLQGEVVNSEDRSSILSALNQLKDTPERKIRKTITDFRHEVQNEKIKRALEYYEADSVFPLLAGDESSLNFSGITTFEMSNVMEMGEKALLPTLLYIFHEIKKSLDGSPCYIHLAEAWTFFGHPVFRDKVVMFLKELRKKNCIVGMDTQSLTDAKNSGILPVLIESCPTKIYLPNVDVFSKGTKDDPGLYETYRSFGLNDAQLEIIRNGVPKRDYYITQPEGNRAVTMNLGPVSLAFCGATGVEDLKEIDACVEEYGDDWPNEWMRRQGVNYQQYL